MGNFIMMHVLMWQEMPQLSKSRKEEDLNQIACTLTNLSKNYTEQLLK
jgi:hypothetical protein